MKCQTPTKESEPLCFVIKAATTNRQDKRETFFFSFFFYLPQVGDEDVKAAAMAACQAQTHQSAFTFLVDVEPE